MDDKSTSGANGCTTCVSPGIVEQRLEPRAAREEVAVRVCVVAGAAQGVTVEHRDLARQGAALELEEMPRRRLHVIRRWEFDRTVEHEQQRQVLCGIGKNNELRTADADHLAAGDDEQSMLMRPPLDEGATGQYVELQLSISRADGVKCRVHATIRPHDLDFLRRAEQLGR